MKFRTEKAPAYMGATIAVCVAVLTVALTVRAVLGLFGYTG